MDLKDRPTITFHSGILTIGGTVIEVAYKDAHIFFDFGTEFRPELQLLDDELATLLEHRLIPELTGVYDARLTKVVQTTPFNHTAVFLSHAHLDHSRMINYLDPAIPLYTLTETKAILTELNRNGDFLIPSPFMEKNATREMIGLAPHEVVTVGELTVEVVRVDHDAYGACALLIRTPEHLITYTGDLRLHGHNPEETIAFCEQAKHSDVLMMEGVSISFPERPVDETTVKILSEEDLVQQFVKLVEENPERPITFNGYPANIQRFAKLVEKSPRTVVLEAKMAALMLEVYDLAVPYYYAAETAPIALLDETLLVAYDTLLADRTDYVWQVVNRFTALQKGTLYIHSDAQPLGDFDPQYAVFLQTLADGEIEFVRLACSGHAFPADLDKIIAMIEPKLLVPIHTLKPEDLHNPFGERLLPQRGEQIVL